MDENPTTTQPDGALLKALKAHRLYRVGGGYLVGAWIVLQVAAIVLPGFGAPPWTLRALMILLALGAGASLLGAWALDRRAAGRTLLPRAPHGRLAWALAALLPAALVTLFFLLRPLPRPAAVATVAAPVAPPASTVPEKSIAVLPFDNFSEDKDSAFFADGVQDEILTDLAHVADLKVISRTSVMQYRGTHNRSLREIGKTLDVAYVVEGSVRRVGDRIRVSAQLIDARTDAHKWAEKYDRSLADVFAIQSEIAQTIANQLQASISPQERAAIEEAPTRDELAYQLYLRAVAEYDKAYVPNANQRMAADRTVDLLRQATARDPGFVRAFTLLAEVQSYLYLTFDTTPATADAVRAVSEAVARLRPGSADANLATGYYDYRVRKDYPRALEKFTEAVRLSPNDARAWLSLGLVARRQGRWEDALTALRHAMELDPESNGVFTEFFETLRALRRYHEAETLLARRLAAHPESLLFHGRKFYFLLYARGDLRAARAELAYLPQDHDADGQVAAAHLDCDEAEHDADAMARDLALCLLPEIGGWPRAFHEGYLARLRGDTRGAAAVFERARLDRETQIRSQPDNYIALTDLAVVSAYAGREEAAVAEARRAVEMVKNDAADGPIVKTCMAAVLGIVGERDEAIRVLWEIAGKPYGPEYGQLRFHPLWEPLRGDPRFEALVASLAPSTVPQPSGSPAAAARGKSK